MGLAASQNCFQIESNCRGDEIKFVWGEEIVG